MDSISIGWNKHSSDEVQILSNRQYFQQDSIEKIINQENKSNKKKVHFNCDTSSPKQQAFENTEQNQSEINRTQRLIVQDHDYISSSSSTDIFASQLPTIDDESICSVRAIVITFVIVVLIIIVSAIAVGIVFGIIIKTSRNTTENANQSSYLTVSITVSTVIMTSSVSIGNQSGPPCSSYTTIDDPSRNVAQIGSYSLCDNGALFNESNGGAWIRFVGSGGTIMPLSSPGLSRCGSYVTGWFNGTLPITFGTMVNASACFTTDGFTCLSPIMLSVIYCNGNGSFYVYYLQPVPFCNARYCTV